MQDTDEAHALIDISKDGFKAEASVGPKSLFAITALVSGILLSTAVLVWVSTAGSRKHPLIARLPHPT